jgi:lipoprotein-anchoring transpeptidase ErfK/SrfK
VTYVITAQDRTFVGPCPLTVEEQATQKSLPYGSIEEFLSERFHCSPALLHALNPQWTGDDLTVGAAVLVPNVEPFQIEALPRAGAWPKHPGFRHRSVVVHRSERMLDVWEGTALIASFPVTPGGDPESGGVATPPGTWHITTIAVAPTFRWDKSVLERGVRSDTFFMLPPGPNNPVGVLWCALNRPGIGIHGTDHPQTIGRAVSHGCIRMANWDVVRFAHLITPGVTVTIE